MREEGTKSEKPGPTNQSQLGQTFPKPYLKTGREFDTETERRDEERERESEKEQERIKLRDAKPCQPVTTRPNFTKTISKDRKRV